MSKWIAEFELEDSDTMPEHMGLEYKGAKIDFYCKPLEQEPGDCISRQAVLAIASDSCLDLDSYEDTREFCDEIKELPPVNPQEPYKDFCEFVAKMVLRDDFEENAGANAEFLCRKLLKLGIVKVDEDKWMLAESEDEK